MTRLRPVEAKQSYSVRRSTLILEGEEQFVYGIVFRHIDDNNVINLLTIDNISTNEAAVLKLVDMLKAEDVDPITFTDIVEDYVAEISTY